MNTFPLFRIVVEIECYACFSLRAAILVSNIPRRWASGYSGERREVRKIEVLPTAKLSPAT